MPRPQFTLRALLVAMLVVGAFFGGRELGVRHEHERFRAEIEAEKEREKAMLLDFWKELSIRRGENGQKKRAEMEAILDDMEKDLGRY